MLVVGGLEHADLPTLQLALVECQRTQQVVLVLFFVTTHTHTTRDQFLWHDVQPRGGLVCGAYLKLDKAKAFAETFRILKPGGHFSISDIVLKGELPGELQRDAELYVGCVSGAIQKEAYLQIVKDSGFTNIRIQKEREITLPDTVLQNYLSADEIEGYRQQDRGIYSVTVFAQKPDAETKTTSADRGPDCCN